MELPFTIGRVEPGAPEDFGFGVIEGVEIPTGDEQVKAYFRYLGQDGKPIKSWEAILKHMERKDPNHLREIIESYEAEKLGLVD